MKTYYTILILLGLLTGLPAQSPMKQLIPKPHVDAKPLQVNESLQGAGDSQRLGGPWRPNTISTINASHESISSFHVSESGSYSITLKENHLWSSRTTLKSMIGKIIPVQKQDEPLVMDWSLQNENTDEGGVTHFRVQQTLGGLPVHRQDMILHVDNGMLRYLNGFAWTGKLPEKLPAPAPAADVIIAARNFLGQKNIKFQEHTQIVGLIHQEDQANLIWYPLNGKLVLAYELRIHPNVMDHWTLFMDAVSSEVIESYSELCSFAPTQIYDFTALEEGKDHLKAAKNATNPFIVPLVIDGATSVTDQDLKGTNRTVNGYQVGSNFFMIDASRNGMFQSNQSVMPNEPIGVIWTIDAQNGSPQQSNFEVVHVTNANNNWKNLEVSAHYNGGEAYEYFRQKFNRNSINGSGGNIISIINVTDENDNDMDNAFWNGAAIFYGNGDVAFQPLAKGLDVAGHEMSHGVIQNTANLEYVGQSGALNESYADIFGAMIDREDWQMGEDVVNLAAFPSGTMRDLSNPNNGGNSLGDPGWQPAHMNEFQNLPNTPQGDNGGVHINSGIANKAFFNLANAIGKDKAEQIYYKALTDYLVKSSQFVDMRNAAEKAATDRHGANSAEVIAVRNAFAAVGIGAGQGEDYEEDIEVNSGNDFIICTDQFSSDLYWIPPTNPNQFIKMNVSSPKSIPSFTDDGTACVYIDNNDNIIILTFDWSQGLNFQEDFLEANPQGIWQNAVVSKDGTKLAFTTTDLINEINVYDFTTDASDAFQLFNPTTANGGANTGDVLYPDVMEWDYSGEYVMYDALNRIESAFGDGIDYWDISFLHAWNNASNNFGTGQISKLFSALPENISIGNPSFAKNSPYIIVFDFIETFFDFFGQEQTDYSIKAANIEAGEVNNIYDNTRLGYPNYSRLDNQILFTSDNNGVPLLATIDVQNSNKTLPVPETDFAFFGEAQKGVWFTTGQRIFTGIEEENAEDLLMHLLPQPATDYVSITTELAIENAIFTISDITGKRVMYGNLPTDRQINIGHLSGGMYFLYLKPEAGAILKAKMIKL